MKKILLFSIVCLAVVFSSCSKQVDTYKTSFEYSFASDANRNAVDVLINSYNWVWIGEKSFKGHDLNMNDNTAYVKFAASLADIKLHSGDFKNYFANDDSFEYILSRTTNGTEKVIFQSHIVLDADGHLNDITVVDQLGVE